MIRSGSASYSWDCKLTSGERCSGDPVVCPSHSMYDCVICCSAKEQNGCCMWTGNETTIASQNVSITAEATETITNATFTLSLTESDTVFISQQSLPGSCFFYPSGTSSSHQNSFYAGTCISVTDTLTNSHSATPTLTETIQHAADTCLGDSYLPRVAPVSQNFTLTVYCRRGVTGEQV